MAQWVPFIKGLAKTLLHKMRCYSWFSTLLLLPLPLLDFMLNGTIKDVSNMLAFLSVPRTSCSLQNTHAWITISNRDFKQHAGGMLAFSWPKCIGTVIFPAGYLNTADNPSTLLLWYEVDGCSIFGWFLENRVGVKPGLWIGLWTGL